MIKDLTIDETVRVVGGDGVKVTVKPTGGVPPTGGKVTVKATFGGGSPADSKRDPENWDDKAEALRKKNDRYSSK